jgi:hypothetical protein
VVIDAALEKATTKAHRGLIFNWVQAGQTEDALDGQQLKKMDNHDLSELTVADLRDSVGRFLKIRTSFLNKTKPLPPRRQEISDTQVCPQHEPVCALWTNG